MQLENLGKSIWMSAQSWSDTLVAGVTDGERGQRGTCRPIRDHWICTLRESLYSQLYKLLTLLLPTTELLFHELHCNLKQMKLQNHHLVGYVIQFLLFKMFWFYSIHLLSWNVDSLGSIYLHIRMCTYIYTHIHINIHVYIYTYISCTYILNI